MRALSALGVLALLILTAARVSASYYPTGKETTNYEWLVQLIEREKLTSIEQVLPKLPAHYRSEYVFMYRSRSLQGASFENPRVILFGKDASFLLTFNGDPKHEGYNKLEIIQFRDKEKRFEFREIELTPGQPARFSGPNPQKCLACHQSNVRVGIDPRPNWEPYSIWPGAYGSDAGHLTRYSSTLERADAMPAEFREIRDIVALAAREQEEFHKLKRRLPVHARYKHLILDDELKNTELKTETLNATVNFTGRVAQLNFQRVARLIRAIPSYDRYKFSVVGVFLNQAPLLPPPLLAWHHARFKPPLQTRFNQTHDYRFIYNIALLFEPLGVVIEDWSMDFKSKGLLGFFDRFATPGHPEREFLDAIKAGDPSLDGIHSGSTVEESAKSLAGFMPSPNEIPHIGRAALAMCASCHSANNELRAPVLPFDDPGALSKLLQHPGYSRGRLLDEIRHRLRPETPIEERMPPNGDLPVSVRESFIQFFESLSK